MLPLTFLDTYHGISQCKRLPVGMPKTAFHNAKGGLWHYERRSTATVRGLGKTTNQSFLEAIFS